MTKEIRCVTPRCATVPVIEKPVPVCALCALEIAAGIIPDIMRGAIGIARRDAAARRRTPDLPAVGIIPGDAVGPAAPKVSSGEARRIAGERLAALRGAGAERITADHLLDLPGIVGKSRQWLYLWLDELVGKGVLVRDDRYNRAAWRFAA